MRHVSRRLSRKTLSKTTYVPEALPRTPPKALSKHPRNLPRVPECRSRDHFPGCRASAPRVPELKPRPYPVDIPTTLRVLSECDTCPRVPPADKTLPNAPNASGCDTCPEPQTTRISPGSPANHP